MSYTCLPGLEHQTNDCQLVDEIGHLTVEHVFPDSPYQQFPITVQPNGGGTDEISYCGKDLFNSEALKWRGGLLINGNVQNLTRHFSATICKVLQDC